MSAFFLIHVALLHTAFSQVRPAGAEAGEMLMRRDAFVGAHVQNQDAMTTTPQASLGEILVEHGEAASFIAGKEVDFKQTVGNAEGASFKASFYVDGTMVHSTRGRGTYQVAGYLVTMYDGFKFKFTGPPAVGNDFRDQENNKYKTTAVGPVADFVAGKKLVFKQTRGSALGKSYTASFFSDNTMTRSDSGPGTYRVDGLQIVCNDGTIYTFPHGSTANLKVEDKFEAKGNGKMGFQITSISVAVGSGLVSCGGHRATRCRLCTVIDPATGLEVGDKGPDWCHGDCKYYDGECHKLTTYNLQVNRTKRENWDGHKEGATTTVGIPDLLNPDITDADRKLMDEAADRSIQEAEYEAQMRLAKEKKLEEEKKDKLQKVLYGAIMSASAILACCAIGSLVALCKYIRGGKSKKSALPDQEDNVDES